MSEAKTWDRMAGRYGRIVRAFDTSYPAVRARLAEDLTDRRSLLEVASGTGQFTAALAAVAEQLVATDISPAMVEALGAAVQRAGLSNVRTQVMSAYGIDAADGAFDGIFCANALHVMDDPQRALAEFRRVLADDGVLVAPTFLHGVDRRRRWLSRAMSAVSPFVARSRFDLDDLCAAITAAGFVVDHREQLGGLFPLGYVVARPIEMASDD